MGLDLLLRAMSELGIGKEVTGAHPPSGVPRLVGKKSPGITRLNSARGLALPAREDWCEGGLWGGSEW